MIHLTTQLVRQLLRSHPLRTVFLFCTLVFASAALIATSAVAASLSTSVHNEQQRAAGTATLDLNVGAGYSLSPNFIDELAHLHGVRAIAPYSVKSVVARPTLTSSTSTIVSIVAFTDNSVALRPIILREGHLPSPRSTSDIALDSGLLTALSPDPHHPLHIGSTLYLLTGSGFQQFTIAGITDGTSGGPGFTPSAVFVSQGSVRAWFGTGMATPFAGIALAPGESISSFSAEVSRLRPTPHVSVYPTQYQEPALTSFMSLLILFAILAGGIALAIVLLITILGVIELHRDIALLLIAGSSQSLVARVFLRAVLVIAVPAGILSLLVGLAGARAIVGSTSTWKGVPLQLVIPWNQFLLIALASIAIPSIVTWAATIRLTSRSPLTLLDESWDPLRSRTHYGTAVVLTLVLAGGGLLLLQEQSAPFLILAATSFLLATLAALRLVLPLITAGIGIMLQSFTWFGTLATRNIVNNQARSRLLAGGIGIGFAVTLLLLVISGSTAVTAKTWVGSLVAGNELFTSSVNQPSTIAKDIAVLPGITAVRPLLLTTADIAHRSLPVSVIIPGEYVHTSVPDILTESHTAALHELAGLNTAIVPVSLADTYHWQVGERLQITGIKGNEPLLIIAIASHTLPSVAGSESVLIGSVTAAHVLGANGTGFSDLDITSSRPASELNTLALYYGMKAVPTSTLVAATLHGLNATLGPLYPLTGVIALLAVLSFMTIMGSSSRQSARTLRLLRVIGMTNTQTAGFLLTEAITYSFAGLVVGVLLATIELPPTLDMAGSGTFHFTPAFSLPLAGAFVLAALLIPCISILPSAISILRHPVLRIEGAE
ncbi:MAG: FtsX-like permease family protein [Candidatus Dormibacteria bacterium]